MPTFRLDFEEWHELYLAAQAVPQEERRPCLDTAIFGLARVLEECAREDPKLAAAISKDGAHTCEVAECQKARDAALAALASGFDPFEATAVDDDGLAEIRERLTTIETKIDSLVEKSS